MHAGVKPLHSHPTISSTKFQLVTICHRFILPEVLTGDGSATAIICCTAAKSLFIYSYIKPQLAFRCPLSIIVVYLSIPTSNHNRYNIILKLQSILLFLHSVRFLHLITIRPSWPKGKTYTPASVGVFYVLLSKKHTLQQRTWTITHPHFILRSHSVNQSSCS